MEDKILVVYSSLTGNTKSVCEKIYEVLKNENNKIVPIRNVYKENIEDFDTIIFGFWVNKGTADVKSIEFIKSFKNKNVIYIGTLAARLDSSHAKNVKKRVDALCSGSNNLLGGFLCRGKVDPSFLSKFDRFPLKLFKKLLLRNIEGSYEHPNEEDFENVKNFIIDILK